MLPRGELTIPKSPGRGREASASLPGRKQLSGGSQRCLAGEFDLSGAPPQGSTEQAASQAGSPSGDNQQPRM